MSEWQDKAYATYNSITRTILISHLIFFWFKFLQVNASGQFCGGSWNGWTKMTLKRTQITGSKKMGWAVNWLLSWRMQAGNVKHIENWIGGCARYVLDLQPSDVPTDLGFFFFFLSCWCTWILMKCQGLIVRDLKSPYPWQCIELSKN